MYKIIGRGLRDRSGDGRDCWKENANRDPGNVNLGGNEIRDRDYDNSKGSTWENVKECTFSCMREANDNCHISDTDCKSTEFGKYIEESI